MTITVRLFAIVRDRAGFAQTTLQLQPGMVGRASVSLRGVPDTPLATRSPVGGQRTDAIDVLRWEAPFGKRREHWSYAVAVIDAQGRPVFSATAADTFLGLPHDLVWRRGQSYVWTVAAVSDEGRRADGSAEFHIVSQDLEDRIGAVAAATAEAHRRLTDAGSLAEDVLFAVMLDQAGLRNDADRQWHSLALARPVFAAWSTLAR